jgi:hypothetical protein
VVRPYGDWLDAHHLFLARQPAPLCYDTAARAPVAQNACAAAEGAARRVRDLSHLMIVNDLQERLRARLGAPIR